MDKVIVKVTLERTLWIDKDIWEEYGDLPENMEDLDILQK